jgi:hypothetical protein
VVRGIYDTILMSTRAELAAERGFSTAGTLFEDELVAYAFIGGPETLQMRR